jgi:tetratricopeptide (TPR) repeat protein
LSPANAVAHLGLGYAYAKGSRTGEAVREIDTALRIRSNLLEACYRKAQVLYLAGQRNASFEGLLACSPQVRTEISEEYQLRLRNMLASNYMRLGNHAAAAELYREVFGLARELSDEDYLDASLGQLGFISATQGQYAQALVFYQQAQARAEQSGSQNSAVNLPRYPGLIGQLYFQLGDYVAAIQSYEQGIELNRPKNNTEQLVRLYANLGEVYTAWQQLPEAITYY